jgi:hypothetical protein
MPTRAQLISRAEIRANMDRSGFPTADQKVTILNEQAASLWAEMVNANYPARRTVVPVTAVSGTASYPLGVSSLLRVVAVRDLRINGGLGTAAWVKRANNLERSRQSVALGYTTAFTPLYDLEIDPAAGPSLVLIPNTLSGSFSVELFEGYPGLATDASIWYGPAPSDEVLVLRTAAAMREKLDPVAAQHLRVEANNRLSELWQVCQAMAAPIQMVDHVSAEEGWCFEDP